ncbi:MAG TPA: GlxA family transcriptional regulator [Herpetosiphonaceae bacterium]
MPDLDPPAPARRVLVLVLPEVNLLDLAGPMQVFHTAAALGAPYRLACLAAERQVTSAQGLPLAGLAPLGPAGAGDLILIPGLDLTPYAAGLRALPPEVPAWLNQAYDNGAQLAAICTGAFALGEAGLLDGRRCTTHWSAVAALRERYPAASVQDNVLYVHAGRITTSAGVATGIDMALALVEQDAGPALAARVARELVVYMRRDSSQPQQSIYVQYRSHLHPGVHRAQEFMAANPSGPPGLAEIAAAAGMSVRSLTRAFREATGLSPLAYQQLLRLEVAANLLRDRGLSIEEVAHRIGFADARHFRRLWSRRFGAPPSAARGPQ